MRIGKLSFSPILPSVCVCVCQGGGGGGQIFANNNNFSKNSTWELCNFNSSGLHIL